MADKLGILINTILNVKQEDLQKQLDSVAKKVKINLKPRIDFDENVIAKFKSDVDKLAKNIKLNLRFDVDKQSVKDAEKTVTDTAKKISEKSKSQNTKIKVFDKERLEAEGRQFFISATGIVNRVKNQFKDLGDVNVNFLKNAKNQVIGFETEIKKLDGTIEKLRFDMAKIKVGDSTQKGFVFSGANLIDKNIGDVLQKNLNTLQKFETRLKNIRDSFTSSRGVKDVVNLNILNKEYNSILSTIEKLRKSHSNLTEEQKRNIDKQITTLNSLYKAYRDIEITAEKGFNFKQFENITGQVIKLRENFEAQVTTLKNYKEALSKPLLEGFRINKLSGVQETEEYLKITQELQKGNEFVNLTAYIDKANASINKYAHSSHNAMLETLTLSKAVKTAIIRMGEWAIAGTLIFGTYAKIKESIQYIHEFDDAIVDLTKVVDLSNQQINEMKQSAIDLGKELGKSSVEIMKGMAEWGRFTKDINEIKELTRVATMASNVSDLSVQEASKAMTTAMIDYKLQVKDMMPLLDSFNEIQNNMRVSAKDLADGISKVGNAAAQSKTPIADLQGYISAIVQSTGTEGSEVGTALKSAISRVYRLGADGEEDAGKAEEQLNRIGVAVRDTSGNFRAFSDIINDVAKKWSTLTNIQQVATAQAIGGTHHYSKIIGLFENFDLAIKATTLSLNSQGSAARENEKYINSITGRIEKLSTTWQDFTNSVLSSDVFKEIISFITAIVNGMNTVPGKIILIASSISLLTLGVIAFKTQIIAAGVAVKGFFASLGPIGWVAVAISALTPVVLGVANAFSEAKKSQEEFIQTTKQQIKELQQEAEQAEELFNTYKSATEGTQEFNDARQKIAELFPTLIVGYDNEGKAILANNEAIKEQIELLKKQAEEKKKLLQDTAEDTISQGQQNINKLQNKINQINKQIENLTYYRDNPDKLGTLEDGTGYATRAEIIAMKNAQIADAQRELAKVGAELREENNRLRETYVALVPSMDNMSEAQKKVANDFINSAIAEQKYIEQGNFNRKAFIEGYTEAINNVELLKKAEAELAEQSKKTGLSQGLFDFSKAYENWSKSISDTSNELKTLNQVIADVRNGQSLSAEQILDLIEKYNLSADAIKKTSDGYTVELSALENVRKAKIQTALDSIEAEKKHALAVKEQVESRLKNYGLEIEQLKNIAAVKEKLAEQADKEAKQRANEITTGASDAGIRNRIYEQVYKEYMNKAGADVDLARKTLAEIDELEKKSKLLTTILNDRSYGVSSSKSSSSKSTTEIYEAEINQFQQLEDALAKVNDEIERNQVLTDLAEDKDKINLLSKRIDLYKEEQKILHQLAEVRRNAIQQNVGKLQGLGFDIFYDRDINELTIRNIERLNQLKGKDAEATNKLKKETDELIKETLSLNDANRQAGVQYIRLNKDILSTTDSIKQIKEEQKKYAEDLIESYQEYLLYTIDKQIEKYEELKKSAQERARREIDNLNAEIERLERKNEELKEQEEREKRLSELAKQRELVENIQKERNVRILQDGKWVYVADPKKLKEETDKLKEMEEDYSRWQAENRRENRIQRLKDQIKEIEEELVEDEKRYDKKIKKLQDFTKSHQEEINKQKFQVTSYSELVQSLTGIEEESYKQRLDLLDKFVKDYNKLISSIKTEVPTGNVYSSNGTNKSSGSSGGGSSSSKGAIGYNSTGKSSTDAILATMAQNSQKWHTDPENRKVYEQENQRLANELKKKGVNAKFDSNTGKWDVLKYDTGGVNDYTGFAILHGKPNAVETVFNAEQGKKLYDFVKNLPYSVTDIIMPKINIPKIKIPFFSNNNSVAKPTENHYHFENLYIQANDPNEMFRKLNMLIEQYT